MPVGYEKPEYKSNAEKAKEQEAKAQPRTDKTASDHTKVTPPKKEGT